MEKNYLAYDVGGSGIKVGILDESGKVIKHDRLPIAVDFAGFIDKLAGYYAKVKQTHPICGIGISSCGGIDPNTGIVFAKLAPTLHYLIGENYYTLRERVDVPVALEKDGNCAALGEMWTGAARELKNFVTLVLGSGLGGAVTINGEIYPGANFLAGDVGYGFQGCDTPSYSALFAPVAVEKACKEEVGTKLTIPQMKAQYDDNPVARKYYDQFMNGLANLLLTMQYILDPDVFLLGGGISEWELLIPELVRHIARLVAERDCGPLIPHLRACINKNDANLIGAVYNLKKRFDL